MAQELERRPISSTIGERQFGWSNGFVGATAKSIADRAEAIYTDKDLSVEEKRVQLKILMGSPVKRADASLLGDIASRLGENYYKMRRLIKEGKYTL